MPRETFTHDDRWKANWWTTSWWEKSRWTWNDEVSGIFLSFRISHPRSGNYCVCDGVCTHTPCRTHNFFCIFSLRDVQTRTRMAHCVCSVCVISLHLALSFLMFHPPSLLFPHGHFDAKFPSAPSSSSVTRPKSAGQAHFRTCAGEFRYLADPTHLTGYEPKEFLTRRPLTIRTTIASLTSRKPHARTLDCSVFPQCLKPLFRKFLMVIFPEMQKGFL